MYQLHRMFFLHYFTPFLFFTFILKKAKLFIFVSVVAHVSCHWNVKI
jgi:hypothetical protein